MPGGFSALSSMYRNIQEPLMEAQTPTEAPTTSSQQHTASEGATGAAMPNPWGSPRSSTTASPSNSSPSTTGGIPNPWAAPSMGSSSSNANPWAGGIPNMGGMPGGMPGAPQSIDQMMALLENPMMSQMMQQLVDSNPDMVRQMIEAQNPMMRQMFQNNPEQANQFIRQMMNPQALQASLQMQRAMQGNPLFQQPAANPMGNGASGLDFGNLLGGNTAGSPPPMDFSQLLQQFQGMGRTAPQSNVHPADRFRSQIQSLRDMGFDDEQRSLAALQQHNGNLNRAVDALLMGDVPAPAPASTDSPNTEELPMEPKGEEDKKND